MNRTVRAHLSTPVVFALLLVVPAMVRAQTVTFSKIADTATTAPEGVSFSGFGTAPSISGNNVAFRATYSGGGGIYTGTVGTTGASLVADVTTPVPSQTGNFTVFPANPVISGSRVAFYGAYNSSSQAGIYTGTSGTTGGSRVADFSTSVPGQTGTFNSVGNGLSVSGNNVVFGGSYTSNGGGNGIYTGTAGTTGASLIADRSSPVPGQSGTFGSVYNPAVSGNRVAFGALYGGSSRGIYTGTVGMAGSSVVADMSTSVPGQSGTFTNLSTAPSISGNTVAFNGTYSSGSGIYTGTVDTQGAVRVADTSTAAGTHGLFTGFTSASVSGSNVAFYGTFSGGGGIFLAAGGNLYDVVDVGSPLFGGTVSSLSFGVTSLDGNEIAFEYVLSGGVSGVAEVTVVPEPATWAGGAALVGVALLGGIQRLRRTRS